MSGNMDFKLHFLQDITDNFSPEHIVGSGGYADVYKGVYDGKEIAVKKFHQSVGLDDEEFKNEVFNLIRVNHHFPHQNVVELVGYCHQLNSKCIEYNGKYVLAEETERILCFEYMQGGTLEKHITDSSCDLDWPTCYQIIKGTCEGINHLHTAYDKPILHLDLKPANILLDNNKNAKIADFGLSKLVATEKTYETKTIKGTLGYMPPEYLDNHFVSKKFDVFSLGVIIINLMDGNMGRTRYIEKGAEQFIEHVCEKWNKRLQEVPGYPLHEVECLQVKRCIEIGLRCAVDDRNKRPSMTDVVDELKQLEAESKKMSLPYLMSQKVLHTHALNSSSGKLSSLPDPDELHSSSSGTEPLDVVIVYAFDSSKNETAWYTVDDQVYWLVQEKLTRFADSCLGFVYFYSDGNTYTRDMKPVDSADKKVDGYKRFAWRRLACTKNMASGLAQAHKLISNRGYHNGIILFFSDGLIHKGDFFNGTEHFISKYPVHTFTLGADAYNQSLREIAEHSPGGKFHMVPVPVRPILSAQFPMLLDSILGGTTLDDEKSHNLSSAGERQPLDVVIVYAFDSSKNETAWYTVDDQVYWLVQEKLTRFADSCLGFIYFYSDGNTYTTDMKPVDSADKKADGYKRFAWRRISCTKNMASGLPEAHKMISNRGYKNGIILFFSDGLIHKGDFFDGTEHFISKYPVHTFTLGADAYNQSLREIAEHSPGGKFHMVPVPLRPILSAQFPMLLDSILGGTMLDDEKSHNLSSAGERQPLDVVIVYAFDSSKNDTAWHTVDDGVYWMVQEKLTRFADSCLGFIYFYSDGNTYTTDMKPVDSADKKADGYKRFAWRRISCTKNMASGLPEAHKMISDRGYKNGIILFFSDGLIHKGDFFDGTESFVSEYPVHTFTLDGDAYNKGLQDIVANSPGGTFNPSPVPEIPQLSAHFSKLLDSVLRVTRTD